MTIDATTLARDTLRRLKVLSPSDGSDAACVDTDAWRDPVVFVRDVLHVKKMYPYQERILRALAEHKRVAVRGPHGLGKTALAAWITLWALMAHRDRDVKVVTTAGAWRQLTEYLWPEIHKWARKADWGAAGLSLTPGKELLTQTISLPHGQAFPVASNNAALIEGAHAALLVYILDEAKSIPTPTFDAIEGAFATGDCYAFVPSTPGAAGVGRFYDIHARKPGTEDWTAIHVTLAEAIEAGAVSAEWAEQRKRQWGESSPVYQARVLGEFPETAENTVIPLAWVEAANRRYEERVAFAAQDATSYGVDVAYTGDDQTVIARCAGAAIDRLDAYAKATTMETAGRVALALGDDKQTSVAVDVIGVGAGVYDRLRELGYNVQAVNVATASDMRDDSGELRFVNLRAALWWMLRERLDPTKPDALALPPHDGLTGDLVAPTWTVTSAGRVQVESKDDIRARLGRSTDYADAVALAVYAQRARLLMPFMLDW